MNLNEWLQKFVEIGSDEMLKDSCVAHQRQITAIEDIQRMKVGMKIFNVHKRKYDWTIIAPRFSRW